MDRAFNSNDRLWIGSNFVGGQQLEFLRKWSASLKPPADTESEEEPTEESVEEGPTNSEQVPKVRCTDSVKKYIESLGDEFFGVPKTVLKKCRRSKRGHSQEDEEDASKETVPEDVEGDCDAVVEDKVKEDSQLCSTWRNPKDDQLEDEKGQAINEFEDDDDECSSFDENSPHETDEEKNGDDDLSSDGEKNINTGDKNNLFEQGLKEYISGRLPTDLPKGFCAWKHLDSVVIEEVSSSDSDSHDSDISIVYEDLLASASEDSDNPVSDVNEDEDSNHSVSTIKGGHGSNPNDSNMQLEVANVPAKSNMNNDHGMELAIVDAPSSSNEHTSNLQLVTTASAPDTGMGDEYWDNLQRKLWEDKRATMDPKKKAQLQQMLSMDDEELDLFRSQTEFSFDEIRRMPFVDKPVVENGLMPILAPPIPKSALAASQALSMYANFSSDPGPFQWSCKSVTEQMANALDDDLRRRKNAEAKEKWYSSKNREDFVSDGDAVFTVVLYHQSTTNHGTNRKLKEPQMAVTVNILASQTLNDLRSKFYCKNDHIGREIKGNPLANEVSHVSPGACLKAMEKNMDKPCGIFVGDTMYINKASEAKEDNYGEALNQWCEVHDAARGRKAAGPFKIGSIETTKMMNLVYKHGFPYLFIHQGNCEHLMVIENVRMAQPQDYLLKTDFPKIVKSNFRTLYCQIDNTRIARYVIRKASWFPQDPMLLCSECLALCFNNDERAENFKLYPFHQISSLF